MYAGHGSKSARLHAAASANTWVPQLIGFLVHVLS